MPNRHRVLPQPVARQLFSHLLSYCEEAGVELVGAIDISFSDGNLRIEQITAAAFGLTALLNEQHSEDLGRVDKTTEFCGVS